MATILQLVDSLHIGGLERVAVDLANGLAQDHHSLLCSTRLGGALTQEVNQGVECLLLGRSSRFDLSAAKRCGLWAARAGVNLVHAHGSSILFANQLLLRWPRGQQKPKLVWHDHFGRYATEERNRWLYRLLTRRASAVLSVNEPLRQWAIGRLGLPKERCTYLPNSVDLSAFPALPPERSPDPERGPLVVCLANFRDQKNHKLLIEAFALVSQESKAVLRLIGASVEPELLAQLRKQVHDLGLSHVTEFSTLR